MPGVGLAAFTKHVAESSAGKLEIRPSFDAKAGIKSADMLIAIAEGRVQAGDAFAGALEAEDPIFALPSLPFLVTSAADAKRLADIARPHLAADDRGRFPRGRRLDQRHGDVLGPARGWSPCAGLPS